jgi:hypothetical protein
VASWLTDGWPTESANAAVETSEELAATKSDTNTSLDHADILAGLPGLALTPIFISPCRANKLPADVMIMGMTPELRYQSMAVIRANLK